MKVAQENTVNTTLEEGYLGIKLSIQRKTVLTQLKQYRNMYNAFNITNQTVDRNIILDKTTHKDLYDFNVEEGLNKRCVQNVKKISARQLERNLPVPKSI